MYSYELFYCIDDYYYAGDSYDLLHDENFTQEEFEDHIKQCVPELVRFYKYDLLVNRWEDRKERQKEVIESISKWDKHRQSQIDGSANFLPPGGDTPEEKHQRFLQYHKNKLEEIESKKPTVKNEFIWSDECVDYLQTILCDKFGYKKPEGFESYTIVSGEKVNRAEENNRSKIKNYNNPINAEIVKEIG